MTEKKVKKSEKRTIPLRPRGEVITPIERPSKTLFDAVLKAEQELTTESKVIILEKADPSQDNPTHPNPSQPKNSKIVETSPSKNFTKVPNSTTKKAIPEKLFKGLSKHTYDVLYQYTRGAIKPVREIQLTKMELQKLTGLSENTVSAHIKHLRDAGFINTKLTVGKHEGSIYEVLVYEELDIPTHPNPSQPIPSQDKTIQNLVPVPTQKLGGVGEGNPPENKELKDIPKTLNKTYLNDDEENPFASLILKLSEAAKKACGRPVQAKEKENWGKLADLLITELEIATRHTGAISNVPAFLTEVLRRRLATERQSSQSAVKADQVGKSEVEKYETKALTEEGREAALAELKEFAGEDFLNDFEKWYMPEDWKWLMEKLKKQTKGK